MAEERSSLATLSSMPDDEFVELVWENGRIHMRGRSARNQKGPSRTADSLYPPSAQAEHGEKTHPKKPRSETTPSVLNVSALSGLVDHRNSDLNFTGNNSSQSSYYLDSSTQLHQSNSDGHLGTSMKRQLDPPSSKNQESRSSKRPGLNRVPMSAQHTSSLMPKKSRAMNFSNLRPAAFLKANSLSSDVTRPTYSKDPTGVQKSKYGNDKMAAMGSSNPLGPVIGPASVPKSATARQNQPRAHTMPSVGKTKESLPDDHSKAARRGNHKSRAELLSQTSILAANTPTVKPNIKNFTEPPVASTSVRSLGASNDPTYSLRRTHEVTEESAYPTEVIRRKVEEPHGSTKQGFARAGTRTKRKRSAEVHNLSEKKRREKFNKKMRVLRQLIPNCNKVDKASMLDEAIEYLKTLQLQLQIMSMGSGICMPQMMLPTTMQHISATPMTPFSPMGAGMGMRMGRGIGCSPGQFPSSELGATALPHITGTRYQMLGFPMSVSHAPFMPSVGRPATETGPLPAFPGAAALVEHLCSTPLTCSKDSNQHINSEKINNAKT